MASAAKAVDLNLESGDRTYDLTGEKAKPPSQKETTFTIPSKGWMITTYETDFYSDNGGYDVYRLDKKSYYLGPDPECERPLGKAVFGKPYKKICKQYVNTPQGDAKFVARLVAPHTRYTGESLGPQYSATQKLKIEFTS